MSVHGQRVSLLVNGKTLYVCLATAKYVCTYDQLETGRKPSYLFSAGTMHHLTARNPLFTHGFHCFLFKKKCIVHDFAYLFFKNCIVFYRKAEND